MKKKLNAIRINSVLKLRGKFASGGRGKNPNREERRRGKAEEKKTEEEYMVLSINIQEINLLISCLDIIV